MHFDDRLATVLQHRADGERVARVQFRQLLDLLGDPSERPDAALESAAYRRLAVLSDLIPSGARQRIAAESAARLRNPRLVAFLASREADVASAALSQAVLDAAEWEAIIPALPVTARGLLRHRPNLPQSAWDILDRLGAYDRALPLPDETAAFSDDAETALEETRGLDDHVYAPPAPPPAPAPAVTDLGALVRRIEAFQQARRDRAEREKAEGPFHADEAVASTAPLPRRAPATEPAAPSAPVQNTTPAASASALAGFLFTTDSAGRFDWVEAAPGAPLVGSLLASVIRAEGSDLARITRLRRPVTDLQVTLSGPPALGGVWVMDCSPRFARHSGTFTGYVGQLRRAASQGSRQSVVESEARIRLLLHELRTPVTAIQGFAEVIQQQTMGPVPHEYRALAAAVAGDAARMLAGFSEIEKLARLEAGLHEGVAGTSDFALVVRRQVARLQTVLSPRVARIDCATDCNEAPVALASPDAETLAWRLLGTLAAATSAGETFRLDLGTRGGMVRLVAYLPAAFAHLEDLFAGEVRLAGGQAVAKGLFGSGFALRLARAEARAVGGELLRHGEDRMILTLPLKGMATVTATQPSDDRERADL